MCIYVLVRIHTMNIHVFIEVEMDNILKLFYFTEAAVMSFMLLHLCWFMLIHITIKISIPLTGVVVCLFRSSTRESCWLYILSSEIWNDKEICFIAGYLHMSRILTQTGNINFAIILNIMERLYQLVSLYVRKKMIGIKQLVINMQTYRPLNHSPEI